jgi:hypothetical protein
VCLLSPAPPLRILDAETAEEVARNREAWADLWRNLARETDAADCPENDDRPDETESDGDPERDAALRIAPASGLAASRGDRR